MADIRGLLGSVYEKWKQQPQMPAIGGLLMGDTQPMKEWIGWDKPWPTMAQIEANGRNMTDEQKKAAAQEAFNLAMDWNNPMAVIPGLIGSTKFIKIGDHGFDPRFDPRAKEQQRLNDLTVGIEERPIASTPQLNLADFEGRPFITSMSDRTAAGGVIDNINGVALNRPVDLRGGQDFMFDNNQGQVWASAQGPVKQIRNLASDLKAATGQDPLYIPWRMAPSGGDFANMTGETMLAYAESAMSKQSQRAMDKRIKSIAPDWKGLSNPESVYQFREYPDKIRKQLKGLLDVEFRDRGGLSLGEARLAVADPKQLNAPDGGVMNVGEIFADKPMIMNSGHPAYPRGVAGQGLGILGGNHNIFEMLQNNPSVMQRAIPDITNPRQTDLRALQMKPYAGRIDHKLLKALGY